MILNFTQKIPKDYSDVFIGFNLHLSNFMIFFETPEYFRKNLKIGHSDFFRPSKWSHFIQRPILGGNTKFRSI